MKTANIIKDFAEWGILDSVKGRHWKGNLGRAELIAEAAAVRWLADNLYEPRLDLCRPVGHGYRVSILHKHGGGLRSHTGATPLEALHAAVKAVR